MRLAASLLLVGTALPSTQAIAQRAAAGADATLIATDRQKVAEPDHQATIPVEMDAPPIQTGLPAAAVFVGAVTIVGLHALAPADFADIVAKRIGQALSPDDLSALAGALSERMHERGFTFASAWIAPQRLANGVLVVTVDEGRIDELRFDGAVPPSVRRTLAPLVDGKPARLAEVERRLLIAGDVDGVRIRSSRYLREGDKGVLLVRVTRDRASARAILSNEGTRPIGPVEARVEADFNGLVSSDDTLTLTYATTPAQPRELQFGYVRYARRINSAGTEAGVAGSISVTQPGAYLASLDLRNRSWYAGANILQPLLRRRRASFWLEGEFGVRNLAQWRSDSLVRRDQVAAARVTLYGNSKFVGGRVRVSATLSQGLGILGATSAGDPLASRSDADGTFTTLNLWSDWTTDLAHKLSLRLAMQGQLASQPLLISEQTSLGGTGFLRGYDWGERTGDEGVMGMAELRYLVDHPFGPVKRTQLYLYVDGGNVSNLNGGFGGGSLASAGGGMRVDITPTMGATFEVAVPLTGPRYDTDDATPKFNFGLVRSF
jgi:hemolysin activation/secretion protein